MLELKNNEQRRTVKVNRIFRRIFAVILTMCILASAGVSVSAVTPNESYTYWYDVNNSNKSVYNRAMYEALKTVDLEDFNKITYIYTDSKDNLYILDSNSKIVILDKDYNLIREIGLIDGKKEYKDAASLYVHSDGTIYLCDTEKARILHITADGILISVITLPDSPLIPDDFNFRPTRVTLDSHGYMYVLSEGSYYGALLYDIDGSFLGFYGANTVATDISTVLTNIKNRVFPNNEKSSKAIQKLPFCFIDIDIDNKDFIYTSNGYTSDKEGKTGQIRRLSPGTGDNILKSEDVIFTDSRINRVKSTTFYRQNIFDIEVDSNGFIYGLESTYGKIFLYDNSCRTLSVFGGGMGEGSQLGTFVYAQSIALKDDGNKVLVADSGTNTITEFVINDFGKQVKQLVALTLNGEYKETKTGWEEILKIDNNFQPAYSGLARAYLDENNYDKAMEYAKLGYDRETYAIAFETVRTDFINKNFVPIFVSIVIIVLVGIILLAISMKKRLVFIKNKELSLMLSTSIHPANNFTDIKEKGLGSIFYCIILLLAFYVVTILQTLAGGFLFIKYDPASFNSIWVFVRTIGLVVLWVTSNWMVCTLLGGKGKLKEIIIVTCYSLMPLIVEKMIRLVLTNVLLPSEAAFLGVLDIIALIYFGIMLITGLLKIHDFSMGRLVGTSILSVAGIAAIVFLIILIVILIQQFYGFIVTVGSELFTL